MEIKQEIPETIIEKIEPEPRPETKFENIGYRKLEQQPKLPFKNKIRKLLGMKPKDITTRLKDEQGNITTTTITYDSNFRINGVTVSVLASNGECTEEKYYGHDYSHGGNGYASHATKTKFDSNGTIVEILDDHWGIRETKLQKDGSYIQKEWWHNDYSKRLLDKDLKPITLANENGDSIIDGYVVKGETGYELAQKYLTAGEKEKKYISRNARELSPNTSDRADGYFKVNGEKIFLREGKRYTGVECIWARRKSAGYAVFIDGVSTGVGFRDGRRISMEGEKGDIQYREQMELLGRAQKAIEAGDKETLTALREEARNYKLKWQKKEAGNKLETLRENIAATKETTTAEAPAPEQEKTTQEVSRTALAQEALTKKAYE